MNSPLKLSLHEHVNAWDVILEWMDEHAEQLANGEIPVELEQLMDEVGANITEKVGRTGLVIRNLVANADAAKAEKDRLAKLEQSYRRNAESLKSYLLYEMKRLNHQKIETPTCKVRRQRNSLPIISPVDITDPATPFVVTPPPVQPPAFFDKAAALEHLKALDLLPTSPTDEPIIIDGMKIELHEHVRIS